ncbi:hypothetical protein HS088_TW16G00958 [Tripterygium wilfordii]|uniref:Uncharacterized protein n=1 Tax=Tripterygium wilfordii TaxID=458696 RepID=A0A7J7CKD3_TRIWF|nr:hypothetical protein HS088_TW16G00958 [Tripterygium wilfordii]
MDGTFNQVKPLDRLAGNSHVFSFDLKSATDRWPLVLQTYVVSHLFGPPMGGVLGNIFRNGTFKVPFLRSRNGRPLTFQSGQPLGYYASWPLFTLTLHLIGPA